MCQALCRTWRGQNGSQLLQGRHAYCSWPLRGWGKMHHCSKLCVQGQAKERPSLLIRRMEKYFSGGDSFEFGLRVGPFQQFTKGRGVAKGCRMIRDMDPCETT